MYGFPLFSLIGQISYIKTPSSNQHTYSLDSCSELSSCTAQCGVIVTSGSGEKAMDSGFTLAFPNFFSSLQILSLPNCEGLARYSSSLQIPNCSFLSIPNQPIFAGEIPGNLFVFIQPSLWERLEFTHEIGNGGCGGVT